MPEETNCRFAVDQTSFLDKAGPVSFPDFLQAFSGHLACA